MNERRDDGISLQVLRILQMAIPTIHIVPTGQGQWSVQTPGAESSGVFPTQGLAVAKAWEMVGDHARTEVIVHAPDGGVHSNLSIQMIQTLLQTRDVYDDAEDETLCREVERLMPSFDELNELMARLPKSSIDYSQEDDELPC